MISGSTSGMEQVDGIVIDGFELEDGDLAIVIKDKVENVLVYWPGGKNPSGYDILKLYSILIRFELTIRDILKDQSTLDELDLEFFRNQIIDESISPEDHIDSFFTSKQEKDKIH